MGKQHTVTWQRIIPFGAGLGLSLAAVLWIGYSQRWGQFAGGALHLSLHVFAIILAAAIVIVAWSTRHETISSYIRFTGAVFIAVMWCEVGSLLIDFSPFLMHSDAHLYIALEYWLGQAGSILTVLLLLCVAFIPPQHVPGQRAMPYEVTLASLLILTILAVLISAQRQPLLSIDYLVGLSPDIFSQALNFSFAALLVPAIMAGLWVFKHNGSYYTERMLLAAEALLASQILLAVSRGLDDFFVMAGLAYKVLAYFLIYQAIHLYAIRRPYSALAASKNALKSTLDAVPDTFFELDKDGIYINAHAACPEEMAKIIKVTLGKSIEQVLPAKAAANMRQALQEAEENGVSRGTVVSYVTEDGRERWFELSVSCQREHKHNAARYLLVSHEITEFKHLRAERSQFSILIEKSPIALAVTDESLKIVLTNRAFAVLTGYSNDEALGKPIRNLLANEANAGTVLSSISEALVNGRSWQGEIVITQKSGQPQHIAALIYSLPSEQGQLTYRVIHLEDITDKKRALERINFLSYYNTLTNLPNYRRLQDLFGNAQTKPKPCMFASIGISNLSDIVSTIGRRHAEKPIAYFARCLQPLLATKEYLFHDMGDHFIVWSPRHSHEEIAAFCRKVLQQLPSTMRIAGQELSLLPSIGVVRHPEDGLHLDDLMGMANTAREHAKDDIERWRYYSEIMQETTSHALAIHTALQGAEQRGELQVFYQPQVMQGSHKVIGAEALLRWNHPELGFVSPNEFIPVAENTGLIISIGEWVLTTVLKQIREWLDAGLPQLKIAVNVSAVQFDQNNLVSSVVDALGAYNVPAHCLELEITEAAAMKAPQAAAHRIRALRQHSVDFAIDDFGTGYSSLSYLKQFKISKLKIDRSFVENLAESVDDQAIVGAVIQMAKSLGIDILAEGVETDAQLAWLKAAGCERIQGYYYGKPMPANEFEQFVLNFPSQALST